MDSREVQNEKRNFFGTLIPAKPWSWARLGWETKLLTQTRLKQDSGNKNYTRIRVTSFYKDIYIYIYIIYYMFSSWWSIKHARSKYYTLPWKCLRIASRHAWLLFKIASHMTFQRCKTTATERVVLLDFGTDSPMALQLYNRWKILQMTKSTRHETSSM